MSDTRADQATPPAKGYARPVATYSPDVRDGVLWLTWRGEYILTSSVDHLFRETMAFPSTPAAAVQEWGELAVVGPHDHNGCIRAAGYTPSTN